MKVLYIGDSCSYVYDLYRYVDEDVYMISLHGYKDNCPQVIDPIHHFDEFEYCTEGMVFSENMHSNFYNKFHEYCIKKSLFKNDKDIIFVFEDEYVNNQFFNKFVEYMKEENIRLHVIYVIQEKVYRDNNRYLLRYLTNVCNVDSIGIINCINMFELLEEDYGCDRTDIWLDRDKKLLISEYIGEEINKMIQHIPYQYSDNNHVYLFNGNEYEYIELLEEDKKYISVKSVEETISINKGKQTCEKLKEYRRNYRNKYHLKYEIKNCNNQNNECIGTCKACEDECLKLYRNFKSDTASIHEQAYINSIIRLRDNIDGNGIRSLIVMDKCALKCKYCINKDYINKSPVSRKISIKQLTDMLKKDYLYFEMSNGGVTFGGGEPLLNPSFIKEFKLYNPHIHVAVETSLNVPFDFVLEVLDYIDLWIIDIKDMNNTIYTLYTEASNHDVVSNLRYLSKHISLDKIICRVPFIQGYNNHEDINKSIAELKNIGIENIDCFDYIIDE